MRSECWLGSSNVCARRAQVALHVFPADRNRNGDGGRDADRRDRGPRDGGDPASRRQRLRAPAPAASRRSSQATRPRNTSSALPFGLAIRRRAARPRIRKRTRSRRSTAPTARSSGCSTTCSPRTRISSRASRVSRRDTAADTSAARSRCSASSRTARRRSSGRRTATCFAFAWRDDGNLDALYESWSRRSPVEGRRTMRRPSSAS